jgi:hypothetical protein
MKVCFRKYWDLERRKKFSHQSHSERGENNEDRKYQKLDVCKSQVKKGVLLCKVINTQAEWVER